MSAWEYSCHAEVYKWYLDDCQDDEEPPGDPTNLFDLSTAACCGENWLVVIGIYQPVDGCLVY